MSAEKRKAIISRYPKRILPQNSTRTDGENDVVIETILAELSSAKIRTPFYVYDTSAVDSEARSAIKTIGREASMLYSMKACAVRGVLETLALRVGGFSCSSINEIRVAAGLTDKPIHFTSPGLAPHHLKLLSRHCHAVSFNSVSQWERFGPELASRGVSCGVRVNPDLSFGIDPRYDPCRPDSKLGISLGELLAVSPDGLEPIKGVHVHNNSDANDLQGIIDTVMKVEPLFRSGWRFEWLNLGGGYDFARSTGARAFRDMLRRLRAKYGLSIYVEPGSSLVSRSGYLVTRVVDTLRSDSKGLAVLDTTINHYPDVLLYEMSPDVKWPSAGDHVTLLAGASCLAGDLFGEYASIEPLRVGDVIIFGNVGAYSMVKAQMFNGIALPDVYTVRGGSSHLALQKRSSFRDFLASYVGVERHRTL